ncbi:MAG: LysR family transcriptional regulator [Geminicoccaceae bacterium]
MGQQPHLDWDNLRIFLAIARAGSLRGAAAALSINHATAARGLQALEQSLGTRLFDRAPSGLILTQAGDELMAPAEAMELEAFAIRRRVAGLDANPAGPLRVSLPPILAFSFIVPDFADFSENYPEIDLIVTITNRFADLRRAETDVSIRIAREVDDDVVGRRLIQYAKGVYAAPAYLTERPNLTVGDGAEAEWIGWGDGDTQPGWVRVSPFPQARLRHSMPEAVLQIEAAAAGMGLTYLPCFIGDPDSRLVRVPAVEPVDDRSIWLLIHGDLRATARVRAFVDFMAKRILGHRRLMWGQAEVSSNV